MTKLEIYLLFDKHKSSNTNKILSIMFTGIIEGLGNIITFDKKTINHSAAKMKIKLGKIAKGLKIGDSVAINGVCLTAINVSKDIAEFEMIGETIKKTNLGYLVIGDKVNIERSLKIGERLEGHFVLGHVDGIGIITKMEKLPNQIQIWTKIPKELCKYITKKGSVTVDGISLTVVDILKDNFLVSIIPHTMKITNMNHKKVGDKVNVETDVLGKYILSND